MIKGHYYPAASSHAEVAVLESDDHGQLFLRLESATGRKPAGHFSELGISPRIGSSSRILKLADGSLLETMDNDAVDALVERYGDSAWKGLVHRMESSYRYVLVSALAVAAVVWVLLTVVIPYSAEQVALSLPNSVASSVGVGSMDILDKTYFEPSELSQQDRQRLQQTFERMTSNIDSETTFKLLFRKSPVIGANAFALPDGSIIMTDELVLLAENDRQIESVLAHEIGHIVHRHGLRRVLQSTGLSVLVVLVTGDLVSATNMAAVLPAVLLESSYSRDMETEADTFALEYMQSHDIAPERFAEIMTLLMQDEGEDQWPDFLSSHPEIKVRISRFLPE